MRLSRLRDTIRPLGYSSTRLSSTPGSPMRTRAQPRRDSRRRCRSTNRSPSSRDPAPPSSAGGSLSFRPRHAPDLSLRIRTRCPTSTWESSPDAAEIEKAILVDVRDLDADLVDVAGEHEARLPLAVQRGERNCRARRRARRPRTWRPRRATRAPVPAQSPTARRVEQLLQKSHVLVILSL